MKQKKSIMNGLVWSAVLALAALMGGWLAYAMLGEILGGRPFDWILFAAVAFIPFKDESCE